MMCSLLPQNPLQSITFLTVPNKAAAGFNLAWIQADFPEIVDKEGVQGDPRVVSYKLKIATGMRIRLTRNMDKEAGFTNGTTGTVDTVLLKWAFVLRVDNGNKLLVYPLFNAGFLTLLLRLCMHTMRRAQRANMKLIVDHWHVDPGYAYVATSRATTKAGVYHVGKLRRKDWIPVGAPLPCELDESDDEQEDSEEESDSRDDTEKDFDHEQEESEEEHSDDDAFAKEWRAAPEMADVDLADFFD